MEQKGKHRHHIDNLNSLPFQLLQLSFQLNSPSPDGTIHRFHVFYLLQFLRNLLNPSELVVAHVHWWLLWLVE